MKLKHIFKILVLACSVSSCSPAYAQGPDIANPGGIGLFRGMPYLSFWSASFLTNSTAASAVYYWLSDSNAYLAFSRLLNSNNVSGGNAFTNGSAQVWTGTNYMTNTANVFAGNGSGLTGMTAAQVGAATPAQAAAGLTNALSAAAFLQNNLTWSAYPLIADGHIANISGGCPEVGMYDGNNWEIFATWYTNTGVAPFLIHELIGPQLTAASLVDQGAIGVPMITNSSGGGSFLACGGILTIGNTNYIPVNSSSTPNDYPGSMYVLMNRVGLTNSVWLATNGSTVPLPIWTNNTAAAWESQGCYRGSFVTNRTGTLVYLFYNATSGSDNEQIGFETCAYANFPLGPWTRYTGNPVLSVNGVTAGDPQIQYFNGIWCMTYNTFVSGQPVASAWSVDLTNWNNSPYTGFYSITSATNSLYRGYLMNSNGVNYEQWDSQGNGPIYAGSPVTLGGLVVATNLPQVFNNQPTFLEGTPLYGGAQFLGTAAVLGEGAIVLKTYTTNSIFALGTSSGNYGSQPSFYIHDGINSLTPFQIDAGSPNFAIHIQTNAPVAIPLLDVGTLIVTNGIPTTSLTGTVTNQINNITGVYTNGWMVFMQSNSFGSTTPPQDTNHIYIMVSTNMPGKWYVSSNSLGNNVWMPK